MSLHSKRSAFVAVDLGAESGRTVLGMIAGERLETIETHRFATPTIASAAGIQWDISAIWAGILAGLRKSVAAAESVGAEVRSVAVDTWGVDYALLDERGEMLELPHTYRDPRNLAAFERVADSLPDAELFARTGNQRLSINTLFQLVAARDADAHAGDAALLRRAKKLVFMPDLFRLRLGGDAIDGVEATIASTSQLIDARSGEWALDLLESLRLPTHLLGARIAPGTHAGWLRASIAEQIGATSPIAIIAGPGHDTACAVAAIPADKRGGWCYLSSGTWSLIGAELSAPILSEFARSAPFTNETGIDGTVRFLKNMTGLWLVQECRREMALSSASAAGSESAPSSASVPSYDELTRLAGACPAYVTLIDPDWPAFAAPGDMAAKIDDFARRAHQPRPASPAARIRCCLDSLALAYADALEQLEYATAQRYDRLHIVGGGSRNELLNQLTADATLRTVIAGPVEATALGNILVQAHSLGCLPAGRSIRNIVRASAELKVYSPSDDAGGVTAEALARFRSLKIAAKQ